MPYNPERVHFNFRWFLEFGGGQVRDRGAHVLSLASWFLDLDDTGPVRVTATGEPPREGLYDCPTTMEVTWEFKDPDLTIVCLQPVTTPEGTEAKFGAVYFGDKGQLVVSGGDGSGLGTPADNYEPPANSPQVYQSPGHHEDWFECIKTRKRPIMDIAPAHNVAKLCIMANIAYRLGRRLEWDHANERFVNDEQPTYANIRARPVAIKRYTMMNQATYRRRVWELLFTACAVICFAAPAAELDEFLARIADPSAEVRAEAWKAAGPLGAPAVMPLAKLAESSEPGISKAALAASKPSPPMPDAPLPSRARGRREGRRGTPLRPRGDQLRRNLILYWYCGLRICISLAGGC